MVGDLAMNIGNPDRDTRVCHPRHTDEIQPMRYIIDVGENLNGFLPRLRTIASEVDPDAIIQAPQPLADVAVLSRLEIQLAALMVMSLSGIGALLAAAGLCALMAFTVSQCAREFGIRIAPGAGAGRVLQTIAHRPAGSTRLGVVWNLNTLRDRRGPGNTRVQPAGRARDDERCGRAHRLYRILQTDLAGTQGRSDRRAARGLKISWSRKHRPFQSTCFTERLWAPQTTE